jgi:hypothetical protein
MRYVSISVAPLGRVPHSGGTHHCRAFKVFTKVALMPQALQQFSLAADIGVGRAGEPQERLHARGIDRHARTSTPLAQDIRALINLNKNASKKILMNVIFSDVESINDQLVLPLEHFCILLASPLWRRPRSLCYV